MLNPDPGGPLAPRQNAEESTEEGTAPGYPQPYRQILTDEVLEILAKRDYSCNFKLE